MEEKMKHEAAMRIMTLTDGTVVERYEKDTLLSEYMQEHVDVKRFLGYCEACSNYGHNWSCSPFDYDPMEIWQAYRAVRIITYKFAPKEGMTREDAAAMIERLKKVFMEDAYRVEESIPESQALFAGTCTLCEKCAKEEGLPCRRPSDMRHSIESIGGDVGKTIKDLFDIEIQWGTRDSLPEYYVLCGGVLMK